MNRVGALPVRDRVLVKVDRTRVLRRGEQLPQGVLRVFVLTLSYGDLRGEEIAEFKSFPVVPPRLPRCRLAPQKPLAYLLDPGSVSWATHDPNAPSAHDLR